VRKVSGPKQLMRGILKTLFVHPTRMGLWFSSELGKVKAVRSGMPPQLHHCQEEVGSLTGTFLSGHGSDAD